MAHQLFKADTDPHVLANEIRNDLLTRTAMSFNEAVVWRSEYPETFDPEDLSSYSGHALPVEVSEQLAVWQALDVLDKLEIWSSQNKHEDSILIGKRNEVIYLLAHWDESVRYVLTVGGLCFEYETLARRCMRNNLYSVMSTSSLLIAGLYIIMQPQRSLIGTTFGTILFLLSLREARIWREHKLSNEHYQQIINENVALRKTLQIASIE